MSVVRRRLGRFFQKLVFSKAFSLLFTKIYFFSLESDQNYLDLKLKTTTKTQSNTDFHHSSHFRSEMCQSFVPKLPPHTKNLSSKTSLFLTPLLFSIFFFYCFWSAAVLFSRRYVVLWFVFACRGLGLGVFRARACLLVFHWVWVIFFRNFLFLVKRFRG